MPQKGPFPPVESEKLQDETGLKELGMKAGQDSEGHRSTAGNDSKTR